MKLEDTIEYARLDHKGKRLLISTNKEILAIEGGKIIEKIALPFPEFHYIFPLYGIYFIVSKNGVLSWSSTLKFEVIHEIPLFHQKSFSLMCKSGNLIAYNTFEEIVVLKVSRGF